MSLAWIAGFAAILFLIALSIALHEVGHLLPAKRFGVKVTQYMVGFGPTVWSRRKGETEYGLKAVPLGGYIRMIGMFPPGPDGKVTESSTSRLAGLMEQARQASAAEVGEEDKERAFYRLPVPQKLVVMIGGPFMNLVLAFVFFTLALVAIGIPGPSLTVSSVVPCVPTATTTGDASSTGECAGSVPSSAALAGVRPGDVLVGLDGRTASSWTELSGWIRAAGGKDVVLTVTRDGQDVQRSTKVATAQRLITVDGQPSNTPVSSGFLGVSPVQTTVRQPVTSVPTAVWDLTTRSVSALATFPAKVVGVGKAAVGLEERDPEGPVSVVGVSRITGDITSADQVTGSEKVFTILTIAGSVNLFLFLFNLLPIPPLDGGHVASALYEGGRRKVAKWRGKSDPGPVDVARLLPITYAVAMVLIAVSVVLVYADLVKPIKLGV